MPWRRTLSGARSGLAVVALLFAHGAVASASEDDWGEDDDGFADIPAPPPPPPVPVSPPGDWTLRGFYRSDWALWTERLDTTPLAKARQSLDATLEHRDDAWRVVYSLHGEYDAAYLMDRPAYDRATLDAYELRLLHGEQLIARAAGPFEITVGRQIVAWGEGDVFSPLDVINPRDLREPGLADLDDLRLAVMSSRVGLFTGPHRVEAMVVHETYAGERAPPMAPLSPFRTLVGEGIEASPLAGQLLGGRGFRYGAAQSRYAADQQSFFLRWVYKGPGLDLGLHAASVLDYQQGTVRLPSGLGLLSQDPIVIDLEHLRYTLVGASGATAFGSWLLKWELAAFVDRAYNTGDAEAGLGGGPGGLMPPQSGGADSGFGVGRGTLLSPQLGVTYTGFTDTVIGVEATGGIWLDEPADVLFPADEPAVAVRFTRNFLRETLQLQAAGTALGWSARLGWLARAEVLYDLIDGLKIGAGYATFHPGDRVGPFYGLDDVDRVFARLRWDFQAR